MRTDKELDELYGRAHKTPGWLSYLLEANAIDDRESEYLIWRDECEAPVEKKMRLWEAQIESAGGLEIYNAETSEEQLIAVTNRIQQIDKETTSQPYEIAETIREICRYRQLVSLRAQLRLELVAPEIMPQWMIDKARAYRLDDLIQDKLKRGFMKCPVHAEDHPSFHVTSYGYCFGCLKSWNSIGWLMDFEKMTFRQAVEYLANKA